MEVRFVLNQAKENIPLLNSSNDLDLFALAPALLGELFIEGAIKQFYPAYDQTEAGVRKIFESASTLLNELTFAPLPLAQ